MAIESWREEFFTHFLLLLVAIIWGSTWAVGRFLSFGVDEYNKSSLEPATVAWLRYAVVAIVFISWYVFIGKRNGVKLLPENSEMWKQVFWLALLGTMAYQLLFQHGMKWTAAGEASLIIPINPVFTVLLAYPMLGQKITKRMGLGLVTGMAGVFIVVGWSPNTSIPLEHRMIGDFMILLAALCWAATSNLTKVSLTGDGDVSALEIVIWYSIVGWLLLTPWMLVELWGSKIPGPTWMEWSAIAYLGIFSTVLSYVWFARGIDRIGPTSAASYVFLVPVFGVLSGWALLGEEVGFSMFLGFLLIVIGVREVQRESEKIVG